jgi:hypothetical protein
MAVHNAVVRGGFLEMREPTALPEGTVVPLYESDDPFARLDAADELDEQERARLHATLHHSWAQAQSGQRGCSIDDVLKDL